MFGVLMHGVAKFVHAFVMLQKEGVEIRRKAFVEPGVGPVLAGEEIAEPLVCQLMGHQTIAGKIQMRPLIV